MLSATKTLGGHSDLLLGAVSVRDAALAESLRRWRTRAGAIPGPFEAWLLHRSLATLELRLERQSPNAIAVARSLQGRLDDVRHPGLDGHPGAAAADRGPGRRRRPRAARGQFVDRRGAGLAHDDDPARSVRGRRR